MLEEWLERWQVGRTGWHEANGNPGLKKYWDALGKRVLVPLCGKTQDLLWLEEQGNNVTGVELSEIAVEGFFEENGLAYTKHPGVLTEYRARDRRIRMFCGDYFAFTGQTFDAHFDRGALIAVAVGDRAKYAAHTSSLLEPEAYQLVITLDYDDTIATGPPFPVPADEVLSYWPRLVQVEARDDIDNGPPKFIEAGLREMIEVVWRSA